MEQVKIPVGFLIAFVPTVFIIIRGILYFFKSHNAPCLTNKILYNHCFRFVLGHEDVPREVENNTYTKFLGVQEVYYGI